MNSEAQSTSYATVSDRALPIYDAFLDLPHPAASERVNDRRIIIAPPPGEAFSRSRDVGVELATEEGLARVASFCFPEYRKDIYSKETAKINDSSFSPGLNRYDVYFKDHHFIGNSRISAGSSSLSAHHSFAMQLSSGQRVYGHVRRYLPHHPVAKSRTDVGRRGVRAMVILTRASASGGEQFYQALLKTIEAVTSHRSVTPSEFQAHSRPQQHLLHFIHTEHSKLASGMRKKTKLTFQASTIFMKEIELGSNAFQHVDYSKFLLPQALLLPHDSTQSSLVPILPLLRCMGISHSLRILSALMCERRIILVSHLASRLATCASSATSMLAQGLLHWQHIYIPILPPSMMNYLAAPMPYLIGVTANHSGAIDQIPGLGEVLVVYLDSNELKTHNILRPDIAIPDILLDNEGMNMYGAQGPYDQQRNTSVADILKVDLVNVMKTDRKLMDISTGSGTAAVAGKGKEILKKGVGKLLKNVVKKQPRQLQMSKSNHGNGNGNVSIDDPEREGDFDETAAKEIYVFGEGFDNEVAEEEARTSFATFFLALIGDMKMYLRPPANSSESPEFDKDLFLQSRQKVGDHRNTPIYPLIVQFKESQIFEQFVLARVAEIQRRKGPQILASPFFRAMKYHNSKRIPFSSPEVRHVLSQISQQGPMRHLIKASENIRRRAMTLTSNNRNEHTVSSELRKLVQDCREGSSFLVEVMCVVWERIKDCRGMQWKHGLYALHLLRELLLHGPIGAVTEATDGIRLIRKLKHYENNMRPQIMNDMRSQALFIYKLLVNRAQLFTMRRVCALRRMEINSKVNARRGNRRTDLRMRMKFNVIHSLLKPGGTAASRTATGDLLNGHTSVHEPSIPSNSSSTQPAGYGSDLLSMDFSFPPEQSHRGSRDFHGMMGGLSLSRSVDSASASVIPGNPLSLPNTTVSPILSHAQPRQVTDSAFIAPLSPMNKNATTFTSEPTIVRQIPPLQDDALNVAGRTTSIYPTQPLQTHVAPQQTQEQKPTPKFDPFL